MQIKHFFISIYKYFHWKKSGFWFPVFYLEIYVLDILISSKIKMTDKSKDKQLNLIIRLVVFCAFVFTAWCLKKLPTPLISLATCLYLTYSYSNEPYLTNNIWGKLPLLTTLIPRRSTSIYSIFKVGWRNGNAIISIGLSFIIWVFKKMSKI